MGKWKEISRLLIRPDQAGSCFSPLLASYVNIKRKVQDTGQWMEPLMSLDLREASASKQTAGKRPCLMMHMAGGNWASLSQFPRELRIRISQPVWVIL